MSYSKDRAMTIGQVEDLIAMAVNAMKEWSINNVDKFDLMKHIGDILNGANRLPNDTRTIAERAQAVSTSIEAIIRELTEVGIDTTGIKTSEIAQTIASIGYSAGVFILDTNGQRWTAASWAKAKEQNGGVNPAQHEGIYFANSTHSFLIASENSGSMMYGTNSHTIPSVRAMSGGSAGEPKDGEYNCRKILAVTNPVALKERGWAIDYFDGMTKEDLVDKDAVFFPNNDALTAWSSEVGLSELVAIGQTMIYVIPHSDGEHWVCKYHSGTNAIKFTDREASVPYTDNYGQVGCVPMEAALLYKEYDQDNNFWRLPSIFELLMMYLNKDAVNECRAALGTAALPVGNSWSAIQSGATYPYSLSLSEGSFLNNNKYSNSNVVLVAS